MNIPDDKLNKLIDDRALSLIKNYLKSSAFTDRKLTDTPTDGLQVVPRKYVTMNGTTANRPKASVIGQLYLDTQVNKPVWWNGTTFIDATGTPV